jgi:lysophospholipase L1-like esterase
MCLVAVLATTCWSQAAEPHGSGILVKSKQTVAFVGDSITAEGWCKSQVGYIWLVYNGLIANGIAIVPQPAGMSGETSADMLKRIKSVLAAKPVWMTLSCGVNDVWKGVQGVELEAIKSNVAAIVSQAEAAGTRVVILTATPIQENLTNDFNKKLKAYNDFLRAFAKEKSCPLADLNADAEAAIRAGSQSGNYLTRDGVHMNQRGDELMAAGILKALGLDAAQLAKARQAWPPIPAPATK